METKPPAKTSTSTRLNLGDLPDGTYTIARCVSDTVTGKFAKDGKVFVKNTTVFMIGPTVAQILQFSKSESEPDVTERGEPIQRIKSGSRVLVLHEHRTYDAASKKSTIVELNGKVVDVQAP